METKIDVYYINCTGCANNVGDMAGPYIINKILNKQINQFGPSHNPIKPTLMVVGSTARDSQAGCIIAGVGILSKNDKINDFMDCWSVRGKHTLNLIIDKINEKKKNIDYTKIILGDTGLIMPFFYPKNAINKIKKQYKYGVILHYVDYNKGYSKCITGNNIIFLNVNSNLESFIDQMLLCEKIITSSLHGLVFAHAYNIPVCWIRMSKTLLPIDDIKFHDYFSCYDDNIELNRKCKILDCDSITNIESLNDLIYIKYDSYYMEIKQNEIYDQLYTKLWEKYGNKNIKKIYSYSKTENILTDTINGKNYFINRIGGIDFDLFVQYRINNNNINKTYGSQFKKNLEKYAGFYDIKQNPDILEKFINLYKESYSNSDIITIANGVTKSNNNYLLPTSSYYGISKMDESKYFDELLGASFLINYDYLENFRYIGKWFSLLSNKKILVISPFKNEIIKQLKIKNELFTTKNKLFDLFEYPEFNDIIFIDSPLTLNNFVTPDNNWLETYNKLCDEIKNKVNDFEVCLLMCGCYASPLGSYIKKIGRSAIYLGGIGQLLFGIKGSRYNIPYYSQFMNDKWIYPDISDKIKNINLNSYLNSEGLKAYF